MGIVTYIQSGDLFDIICWHCKEPTGDRLTRHELTELMRWSTEPICCFACDSANLDTIPAALAPYPDGDPYLLIFEDRIVIVSPWSVVQGQQHIINFLHGEVKSLCKPQ